MIFGPKKELKEKVKKMALNSTKVTDKQIETAIHISRVLQTQKIDENHQKDRKYPRQEKRKLEQFQLKEEPEKKLTKDKDGLQIGDTFFTLGSKTLLKMMKLERFTTRELAAELTGSTTEQSIKETRTVLDTAEKIGIINKEATKFGERAYVVDYEKIQEHAREIKKGLDYLIGEAKNQ